MRALLPDDVRNLEVYIGVSSDSKSLTNKIGETVEIEMSSNQIMQVIIYFSLS